MFPLLVALWKRRGMAFTVIMSGLLSFSLLRLTRPYEFLLCWKGINFPFYFYFTMGMLTASVAYSETGARFRRLPWRLIAPGMIGLFLIVNSLNQAGRILSMYPVEVCAAFMMLAILLSASLGGMRLLSWQPLVKVGTYSYSVYLLHLPLLALVTDYIIVPLRGKVANLQLYLLLMAISLPLILTTSCLFSRVFENKQVLARYWSRCRRILLRS